MIIAIKTALTFLFGYLIGSINLSLIVTKKIGKLDIYTVGSGNAGGTNVARSMGFAWGLAVILAEILKSCAAGEIARLIWPANAFGAEHGELLIATICVFGCLIGNFYPVFAQFRGGKGVSCCGGFLLLFDWRIFLIIVAWFLLILLIGKMVSLGSVTSGILIPFLSVLFYHSSVIDFVMDAIIFIMCAWVIIRHRGNIKRIFSRTERKISLKKKKS